MTKICTRCGVEKLLTEFHVDRCTASGRRSWCKPCAIKDTQRYQAQVVAVIDEFKSRPCSDCGVQYPPYVMDLDHVRGKKEFDFGYGRAARSIKSILAELEKCEVVCANCHRLRTQERRVDAA